MITDDETTHQGLGNRCIGLPVLPESWQYQHGLSEPLAALLWFLPDFAPSWTSEKATIALINMRFIFYMLGQSNNEIHINGKLNIMLTCCMFSNPTYVPQTDQMKNWLKFQQYKKMDNIQIIMMVCCHYINTPIQLQLGSLQFHFVYECIGNLVSFIASHWTAIVDVLVTDPALKWLIYRSLLI